METRLSAGDECWLNTGGGLGEENIYCSADFEDKGGYIDTTQLHGLFQETIFGTSDVIFHSARDGKSVLISVCETHLQFMREMVHAEGKHIRTRSRRKRTQLYLCQSIRQCWETARDRGGEAYGGGGCETEGGGGEREGR
ncbi:hypothetical protein NQZ68_023158 [Dissostichus eleginoides]|nr:hypothetical protein NQZ68_023158 [Dissostichus eleginoides]